MAKQIYGSVQSLLKLKKPTNIHHTLTKLLWSMTLPWEHKIPPSFKADFMSWKYDSLNKLSAGPLNTNTHTHTHSLDLDWSLKTVDKCKRSSYQQGQKNRL